MSRNYELLRRAGRLDESFTAAGESACTSVMPRNAELASTALLPSSEKANAGNGGKKSSGDGQSTTRSFAEPTIHSAKTVASAAAPKAQTWSERMSHLVESGVNLISVADRSSTAECNSDVASTDLTRFAREEQDKLVHRVFMTSAAPPKVVLFSGIERSNGCSHVCAECAITLASQVAGNVCLVDADLHGSTLLRYFGMENGPGSADSVFQSAQAPEGKNGQRHRNLWLVNGRIGSDSEAHNLLASDAFRETIEELRQAFEFVLIDAPPLKLFADGTKLASLADGVVLVVEANSTRREVARKVTEELKAANNSLLAAVLNRRTFPIPEAIYRRL